jgi:hypothetical protein
MVSRCKDIEVNASKVPRISELQTRRFAVASRSPRPTAVQGVVETQGSNSPHLGRLLSLIHIDPEGIMSRLSWTQRLYWRYFAKPASERALFLHVLQNPIASILEIGVGSGDRFKRMIPLCQKAEGVSQIRYAGVDPFESAEAGVAHLPLKQAHRMLAELGVKAHLIPGEAASAIARVANMVLPSDLIIIDGSWETNDSVSQSIQNWLPRLCHDHSTIFACNKQGEPLVQQTLPSSVMERSSLRRAA